MTVGEQVAAARRRLRGAGIPFDEADLDARLLAEHLLGWTRERFLTDAGAPAAPSFVAAYAGLIERRARREPVAYLVGRQEFWGLSFEVSPAVLIPRPETELVVETALRLVGRTPATGTISVADLCTGCGCIAIALAHERAETLIAATDISEAALGVAQRNAARLGVAERIRFAAADLFPPTADRFDVLVSNPPYVPESDRASLQPEVRDHEPAQALFAGEDGLSMIRRIVRAAGSHLHPGGWLVFEFGYGQSDAVTRLISETAGLTMIELRPDLQGIPRVAVARRNGGGDGLPLLQNHQP